MTVIVVVALVIVALTALAYLGMFLLAHGSIVLPLVSGLGAVALTVVYITGGNIWFAWFAGALGLLTVKFLLFD